jgi:hypothetical protein
VRTGLIKFIQLVKQREINTNIERVRTSFKEFTQLVKQCEINTNIERVLNRSKQQVHLSEKGGGPGLHFLKFL